MRIRNGFFRNYFEINNAECDVKPDIRNACYRIVLNENNGFPFRLHYHRNRINADVYHSLADGFGLSTFMWTLVGEYLRLKGYNISHNQFVLDVNDEPTAEEMEDAYNNNDESYTFSNWLDFNIVIEYLKNKRKELII